MPEDPRVDPHRIPFSGGLKGKGTRRVGEGESTILVAARFPGECRAEVEDSLSELERLAESAGLQVVAQVIQHCKGKDPRFFIGEGKAREVRVKYGRQAHLVIFDADLSGSQQGNLEESLGCRVLDRSGLILDLFAQRARTREGMAQVELAQLEYRLSRLVGAGPSLSRLGGGIGTRGPGETQLEKDRRRIRRRMAQIQRGLEKVRRSRAIMRRNRQKRGLPMVCLVGYTNAGKSTLFNALTRSHAFVEDRLFATLDPMVRRMHLGNGQIALLSDTVGFIRKLPHSLIHSFRATLEELLSADLLLHVVDASQPRREEQIGAVEEVLGEIGAAKKPILLVYNKVDRLNGKEPLFGNGHPERIGVSALTGEGIACLRSRLQSYLFPAMAASRTDKTALTIREALC